MWSSSPQLLRHYDLQDDDDTVDDGGDDEQLVVYSSTYWSPALKLLMGPPNPRSAIVDFVIVVVVQGLLFLAIPILRNGRTTKHCQSPLSLSSVGLLSNLRGFVLPKSDFYPQVPSLKLEANVKLFENRWPTRRKLGPLIIKHELLVFEMDFGPFTRFIKI